MPRSLSSGRLRQLAFWLAVTAIAVATRWYWSRLVSVHTPFIEWDTQVFRQIAELPLSLHLLTTSKPLVVPLLYRIAHNDANLIIEYQAELSFFTWSVLTASAAWAVRRRWVRLLAVCGGAAFVLAPVRVGFTGSLMPESVNDSLLALCIAGVIASTRMTGRARVLAATATGVIAVAWLFTRDTNAFIAVTAAFVAMIVLRGRASRTGWLVTALTLALATVALWSATREHAPLPFQSAWYVPFTPRNRFPLVNNLFLRVGHDEPSRLPAEVLRLDNAMAFVNAGAEARPAQDWVVQHGASVYAGWLVSHPLDRVGDVLGQRWPLLTGSLAHYMPGHWVATNQSPVRAVTYSRWVLRILLVACLMFLWRARREQLHGLILCLLLSALAGVFASYYGDAVELARHCYGAAQQFVFGLFLACIAWLDSIRRGTGEDSYDANR